MRGGGGGRGGAGAEKEPACLAAAPLRRAGLVPLLLPAQVPPTFPSSTQSRASTCADSGVLCLRKDVCDQPRCPAAAARPSPSAEASPASRLLLSLSLSAVRRPPLLSSTRPRSPLLLLAHVPRFYSPKLNLPLRQVEPRAGLAPSAAGPEKEPARRRSRPGKGAGPEKEPARRRSRPGEGAGPEKEPARRRSRPGEGAGPEKEADPSSTPWEG